MTKDVIHIYGASGSGTSTIGKALSERLNYKFLDTDDYFWKEKYTVRRDIDERIKLIKEEIEKYKCVVLSGAIDNWGNELIDYFDLVVRVVTLTDIRIERLKKREFEKFKERINEGGDLYKSHQDFLEWAKKYDTGGLEMRSKARHDLFEERIKCKHITVDGQKDIEEIVNYIIRTK